VRALLHVITTFVLVGISRSTLISWFTSVFFFDERKRLCHSLSGGVCERQMLFPSGSSSLQCHSSENLKALTQTGKITRWPRLFFIHH